MSLIYPGGGDDRLIYKVCGPPKGILMTDDCCGDCSARPCGECPDIKTLTIEKVPIGDPYYFDYCSWAGTWTLHKGGDSSSESSEDPTCVWSYIPDASHTGWQIELRPLMSGGSVIDWCVWEIYCLRIGVAPFGGFMQWTLERTSVCPPNVCFGNSFETKFSFPSDIWIGYGKATIS